MGENFTRFSLIYIFSIGLFQKNKQTEECRENTFLEKNPGNFSFLTLPQEISNKTKLHLCSGNSAKLTVLRPKTKNLGNST